MAEKIKPCGQKQKLPEMALKEKPSSSGNLDQGSRSVPMRQIDQGRLCALFLLHRIHNAANALTMDLHNHSYFPGGIPTRRLLISKTTGMVRVLVLHGFAQNPDEIKSKTRQIQAGLEEVEFVFPPAAIELVSFDGDMQDRSRGVREHPARFSWNEPHEDMSTHLINTEATLARLIPVLERDGPFDGIMGFSQGAAAAVAIASILEKRTKNIVHPPLKFAILFCGARPASTDFDALYNDIKTPSLHLVGKLDIMVPVERSLDLAASFKDAALIYHPGNHFIPQGTKFTRAIVDFVENQVKPEPTSPIVCSYSELLSERNRLVLSSSDLPQKGQRGTKKLRMIRRPSGVRVQMMIC